MYNLYLAIQYIGIAFLMGEFAFIMQKTPSKHQNRLLMVVLGTIINFIGYLFELKSTSLQQAIRSVKFIYVGKPIIILAMLFFITEYCKISIPKVIKNILVIIHILVWGLVFFCDYTTLYYNSMEFVDEGVYPHLVLGHGIVYNIFAMLLVLYFIVMLYASVKRFFTVKNKYIRGQISIFFAIIVICVVGYIMFLSGITQGYDTTLAALFISSFLMCICLARYDLLDMVAISKDYAMDQFSDGIVVVDLDGDIAYMNQLSKSIRLSLAKDTGEKFTDILDSYASTKEMLFVEKKIYQILKRELQKDFHEYGRVYMVIDVTDAYNYTDRLRQDVAEKTKEVVFIQRSVIASFATMIEARDGITGLHIKNTSNYVKVLVDAMLQDDYFKNKLTPEFGELVKDAAALHDIGKISIPDYVLQKPGKLTKEEFEIIMRHPVEGANIINSTLNLLEKDEYLNVARDMAFYHHEKWNGKGYPKGLKEEEIPLAARIMAIADVYDALRSVRHYKESYDVRKSCDIIEENIGVQFDPEVARVFLEHIEEIEAVQEF